MSFFYNEADESPRWGNIFLGTVIFVAAIGALGVIGSIIGAASSTASLPGRVIENTMTTDNAVGSYETFRDEYQAYNARLAQIHEFDQRIKAKVSSDENDRLQTELSGQRQSCRDTAAQYNADSSKANHNIFKLGGGSLPNTLDMDACDA